jgi:hypothetical protein
MFIFSRLGIMFDHAGHVSHISRAYDLTDSMSDCTQLGGALSGYLAYYYSGPLFDSLRRWLADAPADSEPKKVKAIRLV